MTLDEVAEHLGDTQWSLINFGLFPSCEGCDTLRITLIRMAGWLGGAR